MSFRAGAQVVRALVAAGCDIEGRSSPKCGSFLWVLMWLLRLSTYFGQPRLLRDIVIHSVGATPLLLAVMRENCHAVRGLLDARADVHVTNNRGKGVLDLGVLFGTSWELLSSTDLLSSESLYSEATPPNYT